jgi:hypothetical protein
MVNEEISNNKENISLLFTIPLNINLTEKLIENLYESQRSWNAVNEKFEAFKVQREISLKQKETSNDSIHKDYLQDRLTSSKKVKPFSLDSLLDFEV